MDLLPRRTIRGAAPGPPSPWVTNTPAARPARLFNTFGLFTVFRSSDDTVVVLYVKLLDERSIPKAVTTTSSSDVASSSSVTLMDVRPLICTVWLVWPMYENTNDPFPGALIE